MATNRALSLGHLAGTASCHILQFRGTLKPGNQEVGEGAGRCCPGQGQCPVAAPAGAALEKGLGVLLGDQGSCPSAQRASTAASSTPPVGRFSEGGN